MSGATEGTGVAVTFESSGFTANIKELILPMYGRDAIETTFLGSTTRTFKPGKIRALSPLLLSVYHSPERVDLFSHQEETITITYTNGDGTETYNKYFVGFAEKIGGESFKVGDLVVTSISITVRTGTAPPLPSQALSVISDARFEIVKEETRRDKARYITNVDFIG